MPAGAMTKNPTPPICNISMPLERAGRVADPDKAMDMLIEEIQKERRRKTQEQISLFLRPG